MRNSIRSLAAFALTSALTSGTVACSKQGSQAGSTAADSAAAAGQIAAPAPDTAALPATPSAAIPAAPVAPAAPAAGSRAPTVAAPSRGTRNTHAPPPRSTDTSASRPRIKPPSRLRPEPPVPVDPVQLPGPGGAPVTPAGNSAQRRDWDAIVRLENQAKAIARSSGCGSTEQCRVAPVGAKACGGPRYYISYCARSTDSAALFRKLDQVAAAERAYNRKYNIMSTCEFAVPPTPLLSGGACTAATGK